MSKQRTVIILAFLAFIALGMPDGLLGVALPSIQAHFTLSKDSIGALLITATVGYTLSSFSSGALIRLLGVGKLLAFSCLLTGVVLITYALTPYWWLFVLAAFFSGMSAGAIDAGLNNYVVRYHGEHLMQWLHASFGIGITMGPIIMTLGLEWSGRWQLGYWIVALLQTALALAFWLSRSLWQAKSTSEHTIEHSLESYTLWQSLGHWRTLTGMLVFLIYTGMEVSLGLWAFTLLTEQGGVDPLIAGTVTSSYWAMFTFARVIAGFFAKRWKAFQLAMGGLTLALVGLLLLSLNLSEWTNIFAIAMTGFAIAPVFPSMVSDTTRRVGLAHAQNVIGMQTAAAGLGGASLPWACGWIAEHYSLAWVPVFLFAAMLVAFLLLASSHWWAVSKVSTSG